MKTYLLVFLISASVAGRTQAEEFDAKQVPVGVHWFFHLDVSGFKKTQLGQFALKQAKEFGPELDLLAKQLQFDFRKDLDSATLFGQGDDEKPVDGIVRGVADDQLSDIRGVGAQHHQFTMGHVDHAHLAKDNRQAQRHQY